MNKQIKLNIHEIEQLLWSSVLETFQQAMVEILSMLDDFLMATRNKSRYEYEEKMKLLLNELALSLYQKGYLPFGKNY